MRNRQTCTVGHLHLILPAIALMDMKALKITRQVVGGTCIKVPILLVDVGGGRGSVAGALVPIVAPAAVICIMPPFFTNLALGAPASVAAVAATISSSSSIVADIAAIAVIAAAILATLATLAVADLTLLSSLASRTTAAWAVGVIRASGIVGVDRARREIG